MKFFDFYFKKNRKRKEIEGETFMRWMAYEDFFYEKKKSGCGDWR